MPPLAAPPFDQAIASRPSISTGHRPNSFGSHSDIPTASTNPTARCDLLSGRQSSDMTQGPLDAIRRSSRAAHRQGRSSSRHAFRALAADTIDALDLTALGGTYHHGGPYDATLAARNRDPALSPVAALQQSNAEALRATPRDYVLDSLRRHLPLQGTATIPPGLADLGGNVMDYVEGDDLMRDPFAEGGPYKRWEGITYHPDDLKGKGEPSYTLDRASQRHRTHDTDIEMWPRTANPHRSSRQAPTGSAAEPLITRQRSASSASSAAAPAVSGQDQELGKLGRRFRSLRLRKRRVAT